MPFIGTSMSCNKLPGAAIGTSSTAAAQFLDSASNPAILYIRPGSSYSNRMFRVLAYGRATTGASTNVTITLYYGISSTIASNTVIEASTARAVNTASANWFIEAVMMYDSTSQKIGGFGRSMVNNLYDAEAALDNAPTSVDLSTEGLGFTVVGTASASNASTALRLISFELIPY